MENREMLKTDTKDKWNGIEWTWFLHNNLEQLYKLFELFEQLKLFQVTQIEKTYSLHIRVFAYTRTD